ncbi:hypothetical protein [uncultured Chitinophaga sp.]|jgi:hypothetical protein|uniref:hypothetical protein n=1 Tax=uncultured Chitinophaga sp. TaxID=339340 RepID=UPI0026310EDD|nr:hypothetical protein [uncultured Chitinophaga sp.]
MKKHLLLALFLALGCLSQLQAAPGRPLLDMFTRMFPNAEYVTWSADHGYHMVSFTQGETASRMWFDDNGALIQSLRYCLEEELPVKITAALKKKFNNKQIYGFTEVTNRAGIKYEVILNDSKKWYRVSVSNLGDVSLKYTMKK